MALISLVFLFLHWRKKELIYHPLFLKIITFCIPLGYIALEAGWTVTEVGRQPWIIYKVMRTKDAVTPMLGIQYSFYITLFVYSFLSVVLIWLMKRQIGAIHEDYPIITNKEKID